MNNETMKLDHIVVHVQQRMAEAEQAFSDLGFTLTPRGYHSLGSINALAIFASDYLELLGLPTGDAPQRPELRNAPAGLNGLVFKTDDADETFAHLQTLGVAGDPPKSFSRPVTLENGDSHEARFRTVTLRSDAFKAGRFYFCEHLTPELVWRPEWQTHANAALRFQELVVVTNNADEMAEQTAAIVRSHTIQLRNISATAVALPGNFQLLFLTSKQYTEQFSGLAIPMGDRAAMFGAITITGALPDHLEQKISANTDSFEIDRTGNNTRVLVKAFATIITFAQ